MIISWVVVLLEEGLRGRGHCGVGRCSAQDGDRRERMSLSVEAESKHRDEMLRYKGGVSRKGTDEARSWG